MVVVPSRRALAAILAAIAAMTCGCATVIATARGDDVGAIWRGHELAERRCASCHAVSSSGPSRNSRAPTFPAISARYSDSGLGRELEAIAVVGHYAMPTIELAPDERADLIAYVASLRPVRVAP